MRAESSGAALLIPEINNGAAACKLSMSSRAVDIQHFTERPLVTETSSWMSLKTSSQVVAAYN